VKRTRLFVMEESVPGILWC